MSKVGSWTTNAGGNSSTPPDGWPEGQAPSTINDCAREMMAQIRTVFSDHQYFDHGMVPSFVNATTFSVPGDQTAILNQGRRLKLFDSSTIYRGIQNSVFGSVTTVSLDSGTNITANLSSFAVGVVSGVNTSLPKAPQVIKAWCAFSGVGIVTLGQSFNVTSISDNGIGDWTINLTDALSASGYAVLAYVENDSAVLMVPQHNPSLVKSATAYQIKSQNTANGALTDSPQVYVGFFGT